MPEPACPSCGRAALRAADRASRFSEILPAWKGERPKFNVNRLFEPDRVGGSDLPPPHFVLNRRFSLYKQTVYSCLACFASPSFIALSRFPARCLQQPARRAPIRLRLPGRHRRSRSSSFPSTAPATSRSGSAAARWPKRTGAHFTYFLSCVYPACRKTHASNTPRPAMAAGQVQHRLCSLRKRMSPNDWSRSGSPRSEGHDIASHACGHFDGKGWSKADWLDEFGEARRILENAYTINDISTRTGRLARFRQDRDGRFPRALSFDRQGALQGAAGGRLSL